MLDEPKIFPVTESEASASGKRLGTESDGLSVLLEDKRMQALDLSTKKRILELLMVSGAFKPQTFDAVMTQQPVPPLTGDNIEDHIFKRTASAVRPHALTEVAPRRRLVCGSTDGLLVGSVAKVLLWLPDASHERHELGDGDRSDRTVDRDDHGPGSGKRPFGDPVYAVVCIDLLGRHGRPG